MQVTYADRSCGPMPMLRSEKGVWLVPENACSVGFCGVREVSADTLVAMMGLGYEDLYRDGDVLARRTPQGALSISINTQDGELSIWLLCREVEAFSPDRGSRGWVSTLTRCLAGVNAKEMRGKRLFLLTMRWAGQALFS